MALLLVTHAVSLCVALSDTKQTPVMGFNTWNSFRCEINETLILQTTDLLISTGLTSAGYQYMNIDDCWSSKDRDVSTNKIRHDPIKFPHGIKYIADYIHDRGLKFGIYGDAGTMTCAGFPGSVLKEELDAQLFVNEYDIDLLKYDWCHARESEDINTSFAGYIDYYKMKTALNKYGDIKNKHIVFSMCNWGRIGVKYWGNKLADSWRISGDIFPFFDFRQRWKQCLSKMRWCHLSIMEIIDEAILNYDQVTCGHFMDLDMLVIGFYDGMSIGFRDKWFYKMGGLTYLEQETHFILWCLYQSPLIIGYDLRKIDDKALNLLKHKTLIDINQDRLCKAPKLIKTIGENYQYSIQLFLKHLYDKRVKMLNVLNRDYKEHRNIHVYFRWIVDEMNDGSLNDINVKFNIYDVMQNKKIGEFYCCRDLNEYFVIHHIGIHQSILFKIEIEEGHTHIYVPNKLQVGLILLFIGFIILYHRRNYIKSKAMRL